MKVYIAGKITGNPNYKKEFEEAEEWLTKQGHEVFNPAKNQGYSYRQYINAGLYQLMNCDAIYLLPNFAFSKGALLEYHYANTVGLERIERSVENG